MSEVEEITRLLKGEGVLTTSLWKRTMLLVSNTQDLPDSTLDPKVYIKEFNGCITDQFDTTQLPAEGPNRAGDTIQLFKKDGSFKWSSWSGSSRFMQNLSDISKAIHSGWDRSDPSISRGELRKFILKATPVKKTAHDLLSVAHTAITGETELTLLKGLLLYVTQIQEELEVRIDETPDT